MNQTNKLSVKSWVIIVAEALVFLMLLGTTVKCSNDKINVLNNNIDSYRDAIAQVELQNGELLASRQSLILSEKQAREELGMTKEELNELKKTLGSKVAQISKLTAQLSLKDTVFMNPDTVYIDKSSNVVKTFSWGDQWTSLSAEVYGKSIEQSRLNITDLNMTVPLEFGVTDEYKVFVKSPNPYINFTDMTSTTIYGSTVYPKTKRLHHGIHVGFGLNYGLINKQLDIGPSITYGLTYSF